MEIDCNCCSTDGHDFAFRLPLWRCSSGTGPQSGTIIALSLDRCSSTGTSPPMGMNCNCCSTDGDDFAFRLHLWRCSSETGSPSGRISALSLVRCSSPGKSPPMEMNCNCCPTDGDDFAFRLHLWPCASGTGPQSGTIIALSLDRCSSTGTSPPMEMNCNCCSTDGDDFAFRLHLWRCSSGTGPQSGTIIALSLDLGSAPGTSPLMATTCMRCSTDNN